MAAPAGNGRDRRRRLLSGGLVVLFALALYAFLMSPAFRLQRIVISGTSHVTPERVAWATALQRGDLRWRQAPAALRQRLLEAEPWLADAQVRWQWGGLLAVSGQERRPVALIPYHNLFAVVDAEGRVLEVATVQDYRLPVITGVSETRLLRGDVIQRPELPGALKVAALLPPTLTADLGEIHVAAGGDITLMFAGPLTVRLGRPEVLDQKVLALTGIYADARRDRMNVELVSPERPVLVPRR